MLSAEHNDLITRTNPGTAAGALLRRYWQPAALVDELAGNNRPVKAVRLMGEDLRKIADPAPLREHMVVDPPRLALRRLGSDHFHARHASLLIRHPECKRRGRSCRDAAFVAMRLAHIPGESLPRT